MPLPPRRRVLGWGGAMLVGMTLASSEPRRMPTPDLPSYPVEPPPVPDDRPVPKDALVVAIGGTDRARGTWSDPLATIDEALKRARPGATVVVRAGVWRTGATIVGLPGLTLRSAPGEQVWFDGTTPLGGFARSSAGWALDGYGIRLDSSPTFTRGAPDNDTPGWAFVGPQNPLASDPQQIWLDTGPLVQVPHLGSLGPGTFHLDHRTRRLTLGDDPSGRRVSAGRLPRALTVASPEVHIVGLGFRRFVPAVPDVGAIRIDSPSVLVDGCIIAGSSTIGLSVGASDVQVRKVTITGCGMLGLHAHHADRLALVDVTASHNNRGRFNEAPVAGGVKVTTSRGVAVRTGSYSDNYATGFWVDESVTDVTIHGADMLRNTHHGIHAELSSRVSVTDVRACGNGRDGICVQNTDQVRITDCTVAGNARGVDVLQDERRPTQDAPGRDDRGGPQPSWVSRDIDVRRTILASGSAPAQALFAVEDLTRRADASTLGITLKSNAYVRSTEQRPRWTHVWSRPGADPAVFTDVAAFTVRTGQDGGSVDILDAATSNLAVGTTTRTLLARSFPPAPAGDARRRRPWSLGAGRGG